VLRALGTDLQELPLFVGLGGELARGVVHRDRDGGAVDRLPFVVTHHALPHPAHLRHGGRRDGDRDDERRERQQPTRQAISADHTFLLRITISDEFPISYTIEKNASTAASSCTTGAGGNDAMKRRPYPLVRKRGSSTARIPRS